MIAHERFMGVLSLLMGPCNNDQEVALLVYWIPSIADIPFARCVYIHFNLEVADEVIRVTRP